jgi:hypothetical protein
MLYALLGRVIWVIFRGYFRHRFPHARRNLAVAGGATLVLAGAAAVVAVRGRGDEFRGARRS